MFLKTLIAVLSYLWGALAWAGQISLTSGDTLAGELAGIEGDVVLWRSSALGELKIQKSTIKQVKSDAELKLRGKSVPCVWLAITEDERLIFRCADKTQPSFPFLSVKHVVRFENHEQANFDFTGQIRASGWRQSGNTNGKYWEMASRVSLRHSDIRHVFSIQSDGQQTEVVDNGVPVAITFNRHLMGVYNLDWFFLPRWYWSNKISGERDDNRNIQEEYALASGVGHQFWETQKTALSLDVGMEHSSTYLRNNPLEEEPERYNSVRLGSVYRFEFPNGLKIQHTNEMTRSIKGAESGNSDRWKVKFDTGLAFPIGFGISASLNVKWDYINYAKDLDPNASREDTTVRVGVNYAW